MTQQNKTRTCNTRLEDKRIVLFNSSFTDKRKDQLETTVPHLRIGVASIAAYLRSLGAIVSVIDPQLKDFSAGPAAEAALELQPDFVGLPAYTVEINDAASIAREIKLRSVQTTVIIGGYHISALPEQTLEEYGCFDFGIIGEGEQSIAEIMEGSPPESIQGIVYRDDQGTVMRTTERKDFLKLDELPRPAWDLYDLGGYKPYDDRLPIEPVRRCPFNCIFCFRASGTKADLKSPQMFVEELEHYVNAYGYKHFLFLAGSFPLRRSHAMEVCDLIIAKKLDIHWTASSRVDLIDEELAPKLKRSGCTALQFGIESGSKTILDFCAKGITPAKALESVRLCKKAGISPGLNFIIGLPYETRKTMMETFRLSWKLLRYSDSVNYAILVPFPGTKIYRMALNGEAGLGLTSGDWSDFGKQIGLALEHPNFTQKQLQRYQALFYLLAYLRKPAKALKYFTLGRFKMLITRLFKY